MRKALAASNINVCALTVAQYIDGGALTVAQYVDGGVLTVAQYMDGCALTGGSRKGRKGPIFRGLESVIDHYKRTWAVYHY